MTADQRSGRVERCAEVNLLIEAIARHGRRFFYNIEHNRVARMRVDARSKVWFRDDYSDKEIFVADVFGCERRWKGFSHGGTMRSLVEAMNEYIVHGAKIPRWRICTPQLFDAESDVSRKQNVWGYSPEEAEALRAEAFALPCLETAEEERERQTMGGMR